MLCDSYYVNRYLLCILNNYFLVFELFLTTNCCSFGAVFRVVLLQFCAVFVQFFSCFCADLVQFLTANCCSSFLQF
ncbi:hypothetical protein HanRHA438_Chr06g0279131 [Helianthus annuus]|nr:hypothetical protein HanRHA438_Chr06g0279131 [Helianthus annuus]